MRWRHLAARDNFEPVCSTTTLAQSNDIKTVSEFKRIVGGAFAWAWRVVHQLFVPSGQALLLAVRAYFSVYYYTKCVVLKAGCSTLKRKLCNVKFLH